MEKECEMTMALIILSRFSTGYTSFSVNMALSHQS